MRHLPVDEIVHRLVRETACTRCARRPRGSDALGPEVMRSCEPSCPLFLHLPALVRLARQADDAPGTVERAVKNSICAGCHLRPTSGDYCADYDARTCPLSTFSLDVLSALERVPGLDAAARVSS
jgi:hypothetical protein